MKKYGNKILFTFKEHNYNYVRKPLAIYSNPFRIQKAKLSTTTQGANKALLEYTTANGMQPRVFAYFLQEYKA